MCRVGTTMDHELCDFILATVEAINYKAAGGFLDDHLPRTRIEVGCASSRTKHPAGFVRRHAVYPDHHRAPVPRTPPRPKRHV